MFSLVWQPQNQPHHQQTAHQAAQHLVSASDIASNPAKSPSISVEMSVHQDHSTKDHSRPDQSTRDQSAAAAKRRKPAPERIRPVVESPVSISDIFGNTQHDQAKQVAHMEPGSVDQKRLHLSAQSHVRCVLSSLCQ